MRALLLSFFLVVCGVAPALADDAPGSNKLSTPITVAFRGPKDYPPGAQEKGEEGTTLVFVTIGDGGKTAKVLQSSGYADLDAASVDVAMRSHLNTPLHISGEAQNNNVFAFAVIWSLKPPTDSPPKN